METATLGPKVLVRNLFMSVAPECFKLHPLKYCFNAILFGLVIWRARTLRLLHQMSDHHDHYI